MMSCTHLCDNVDMSSKRRARLPRERRMREIMQVAEQVFRDKGYSEALTAEIAARAGWSRAPSIAISRASASC
jgi:AcrR family transcriptional regulator